MKKLIFIFAVILFAATLCFFSAKPIVSCEIDLPDDYIEAVEGQAKGVYSKILPLVPVYVSVEKIIGNRVFYTIRYFPFGSVGMSYAEGDGYNIEKPLTGF